jgi:hypothetical protein
MPQTVNGIGTTVYTCANDCGDGNYDAVEWFVFLFMPILPLTCLHTFDWNGNEFRRVRLKWSWRLVFRSFLSGWRGWFLFVGIFFLAIGVWMYFGGHRFDSLEIILPVAGTILLILGILGHLLLRYTGNRTRKIRTLLGRHTLGTADPAMLRKGLDLSPQQMYGALTFAEAAEELLSQGRYPDAMWAARLCAAQEDRREGEQLTDRVLERAEL